MVCTLSEEPLWYIHIYDGFPYWEAWLPLLLLLYPTLVSPDTHSFIPLPRFQICLQ